MYEDGHWWLIHAKGATVVAPTWNELWRALAPGPGQALTGTYTVVRPRRTTGQDRPAPGRLVTTEDFAFQPPGSWRCAYRDPLAHGEGALWIAAPGDPDTDSADESPSGLSFSEDRFPWDFAASPQRLVLVGGGGPLAAAAQLTTSQRVTHAGTRREGWSLTLDVPLAGRLQVVVDDEEGLILRVASPNEEYREELHDLAFPGRLPETLFDSQDVTDAQVAWEERWRAAEAAARRSPLPVPGYWPSPRGNPSVIDGDLSSGLLVVDLNPDLGDDSRAEGPVGARLARQRPGDPLYLGGVFGDPAVCVHTWQDGNWTWSLATEGPGLTREQLSKVIASMTEPQN